MAEPCSLGGIVGPSSDVVTFRCHIPTHPSNPNSPRRHVSFDDCERDPADRLGLMVEAGDN